MKKKRIIIFTAVAVGIVGLLMTVLVLAADNTLSAAGKNCDTIEIRAEYNPDKKTLDASQTVRYKNRSSLPINEIKFHTYANAYREGAEFPPVTEQEVPKAYPNGKSFGGIEIKNIKANGKDIESHTEGDDKTLLCVHLPQPLTPNDTAEISMDYTITLANIMHRLGYTDKTVNLGNFYPVPCIYDGSVWQTYPYSSSGDPFYNALHNFKVSLTIPQDFIAASSGTLQKSSADGSKKTMKLEATAIRDFAAVLSKEFKTKTRLINKVAVNYFYIDDTKSDSSLETAVKALTLFSNSFMNYPYKQLSVVQTDFLHGGMEYGELVYVSRSFLQNETAAQRTEHDRVIIHEIAHQWWYGIIGNDQTRTAWIDEGLAEYSTLLFYDNYPEYAVNKSELIDTARTNYASYVKIIKAVGGSIDPNMNRDLNSFNSSAEYVLMTYIRGMLLFCDLEKMLGKEQFLCGLKCFADDEKFTIAGQEQLIRSLEKCTEVRLQMFFSTYLLGQES